MRPTLRLWRRFLFVALCAALAGCGSDTAATTAPTPTPTHPLPPLATMLSEKVMGSATAPVTMIEYSSLTCSHCGDFHVVTFPLLKANYVDTGQLKVVVRDFPLNDAALSAAMVARCSGDLYFAVVDRLFASQYSWAFDSDWKTALKQVVAPLGTTPDDVDACLAQQELKDGINAIKQQARDSFGVNGTPTFIINGQKVVGALGYAEFEAAIKAALGQ